MDLPEIDKTLLRVVWDSTNPRQLMSVPPFKVSPMEILTQMAPFEAQLSPKDGSESFFLRVFALDTRMAIEKLIVNLPLDWQGDIELWGESVARRFFIYPRLVCESMEQI